MKELSCEEVLIAQMALRDREEPPFAKEHVDAHVAGCANCQHEPGQVEALDQVLASQTISEQRIDLWPAIENRIAKRPTLGWKPFALIGSLLVIYKMLEMLPAQAPGLAFKLVPLVIVGLLFVLIKENPFRINTELVMER
jgi:hypothetical protein